MPPAMPARALVGFDAAAFDGARFAVVVFAAAAFGLALADAELVEDFFVDRRVFFGEPPIGSALLTALPALEAAPPTALPAVMAASPTALPALVAAPPTALPGPDDATDSAALPTALPGPEEATDSAALPTAPAALPTVFPTFLPTLFTSLVRSAIVVLLIRPVAGRSNAVWLCICRARPRDPPSGRSHSPVLACHTLLSVTDCLSCGAANAAGARFCSRCGTALSPAAADGVARRDAADADESRKMVTVLFADVAGSTAVGERVDPETLRRVMSRHFDETRRIVEEHGGVVEKFIGDAVMAVFGIPRVHEDDAMRAVRAALVVRDRLAELDAELRDRLGTSIGWRIGVNTGQVVAGDAGAASASCPATR